MKSVLVFGGCGALGRALLSKFREAQFRTVCVDVLHGPPTADMSILLDPKVSMEEQAHQIEREIHGNGLGGTLHSVLCANGGWAGGSCHEELMLPNAMRMISSSLFPTLVAARVAGNNLIRDGGLFVTFGAEPALKGTPYMLGYGVAKAAVMQLTQSLGDTHGGLRGATSLCLLPRTLDTLANRKSMSGADTSSWTPPDHIASKVLEWALDDSRRPPSGSLVDVLTTNVHTQFRLVQCTSNTSLIE